MSALMRTWSSVEAKAAIILIFSTVLHNLYKLALERRPWRAVTGWTKVLSADNTALDVD